MFENVNMRVFPDDQSAKEQPSFSLIVAFFPAAFTLGSPFIGKRLRSLTY